MTATTPWDLPTVDATWCAGRVDEVATIGYREDEPITPASVMKVQVAIAAASAMQDGRIDGPAPLLLDPASRTPGPVGMSLLHDPVTTTPRDLLPPMLTLSDNAATDALLSLLGVEAVNAATAAWGMPGTWLSEDLAMLDGLAREIGFARYAELAAHDHTLQGPRGAENIRHAIARSAALDPARGSRTTPADMVRLLRLIWTDAAGPAPACALIRELMSQQLTQHRIASGAARGWSVAAKSGGLFGIVRNEVGVVIDETGTAYVIAVFTRQSVDDDTDPRDIDAAIGRLARRLVDRLRDRGS